MGRIKQQFLVYFGFAVVRAVVIRPDAVVPELIFESLGGDHGVGRRFEGRIDVAHDVVAHGQRVRLLEVEGNQAVGLVSPAFHIENRQGVRFGGVVIQALLLQLCFDVAINMFRIRVNEIAFSYSYGTL